jgi:toxin ParE1/3/4
VKLVWSQLALEDRRAIFDYIEIDDPRAAVMVDERISAATRHLIDFPNSGRPGRLQDTRELVIARTPYVAPYRIEGEIIRILRVIHGARLWPDEIPDDD